MYWCASIGIINWVRVFFNASLLGRNITSDDFEASKLLAKYTVVHLLVAHILTARRKNVKLQSENLIFVCLHGTLTLFSQCGQTILSSRYINEGRRTL